MLKRIARGFSLIELMIALAIGATIIGAAISLLLASLGLHRDLLQALRSQQDLRLLVDVALRDLARAGHWRVAGNATAIAHQHDLLLDAVSGRVIATAVLPGTRTPAPAFAAPLLAAVLVDRLLRVTVRHADQTLQVYELRLLARNSSTQISLDTGSQSLPVDRLVAGSWMLVNPFTAIDARADCASFRYDENGDGVLIDQEHYGYRLDSRSEALEASNNARSCDHGHWQNLSDERVLSLRQFGIQSDSRLLQAGYPSLQQAFYALSLSASPRRDAAAVLQIEGAVRVRNALQP